MNTTQTLKEMVKEQAEAEDSWEKPPKEPMKKYQIILADPPWKQSKGGKKNVRPNSSGEKLD